MKHRDRIFDKINNLLAANYNAEKVYSEISITASNESLRKFFKERQVKRHEFNRVLVNILHEHNIIPKSATTLGSYHSKIQGKENRIKLLSSGDTLLFEVFRLKNESLSIYDGLLIEMSLPLSLCKALSKQRDDIQAAIQILARDEVNVY